MRKISIFAVIVILAGVISFSPEAFGQGKSKVLMIPREGYSADLDLMIKMEIGVMRLLLKNAGLDVDIATTTGISILGPTEKITGVKALRTINIGPSGFSVGGRVMYNGSKEDWSHARYRTLPLPFGD
jgi:hypothetical protein